MKNIILLVSSQITQLFLVLKDPIISSHCLLVINIVSALFKLYIVVHLIPALKKIGNTRVLVILLLSMLVGAFFSDMAWIVRLCHTLFFSSYNDDLIRRSIKFAWALTVIQYQASAIFTTKLCSRNSYLTPINIIFIIISSVFYAFFCSATFFTKGLAESNSTFILHVQYLWHIYMILLLMPISLVMAILNLRNKNLPVLLYHQAKLFIITFAIPQLVCDFLQLYHFNFSSGHTASSYAFAGLSTGILTLSIYFCARKFMGLRFLNFTQHVQSKQRYAFVDYIKQSLDQLSQTTSIKDLNTVTKHFFNAVFNIPFGKVELYIRNSPDTPHNSMTEENKEHVADSLFASMSEELKRYIESNKILIYDELAFTNFYTPEERQRKILDFLEYIKADIFIPIYKYNNFIAYIIIERHARGADRFYTDVERDEIIIYCQYLSNVIHLIQHRSLSQLLENERVLQEQLYIKHQEFNQLQESIKTIVKNSKTRESAILFYRHRHLIAANNIVEKILGFNLMREPQHILAKRLRELGFTVESNYASRLEYFSNGDGIPLVAHGSMCIINRQVLISISYADTCDAIKEKMPNMQDPSGWDYLLYLETTRSGRLINELVPACSPSFLGFKISLLKASLGNHALLLILAEKDLVPAAEIIHNISLREKLHILTIDSQDTLTVGRKLFGINPLFNAVHEELKEDCILDHLKGFDTLFIQNVHNLDKMSQEHLAELIKYGSYRSLNSDFKKPSSVRVICSSSKDLEKLASDGLFSAQLYEELKKTSLMLPLLKEIAPEEIKALMLGFGNKLQKDISELLTVEDLNNSEGELPISLADFKMKVDALLRKKAHHKKQYTETKIISFPPLTNVSKVDEKILENARKLGKYALRDKSLMHLLWNTFKSQNKIAQFLGIHRASVCRWCKKYNLTETKSSQSTSDTL